MSKEKILEAAEKLVQSGKYDKALREYQKVLSENPKDMRTKVKVAEIQLKAGQRPEAIKTYREVAEDYVQDQFHLKAVAVYKTILKLSPTLIDVNEKLGDLYRELGVAQEAIDQYQIVANYYDQKSKFGEATEVRKKIVAVDPASVTGRIRLAELFQAEGRPEDSLREYQNAAEILGKKKDRLGLIEVYEKILHYRPGDLTTLLTLAQIYFERKEFKKILGHMNEAPVAARKNLGLQKLWAETLLEERQRDAARKKFREAYALSIEDKKPEESARLYSRILQEFGDDPDYLKELDALGKTTGLDKVAPKFREDFETTEMINLNELNERSKKK